MYSFYVIYFFQFCFVHHHSNVSDFISQWSSSLLRCSSTQLLLMFQQHHIFQTLIVLPLCLLRSYFVTLLLLHCLFRYCLCPLGFPTNQCFSEHHTFSPFPLFYTCILNNDFVLRRHVLLSDSQMIPHAHRLFHHHYQKYVHRDRGCVRYCIWYEEWSTHAYYSYSRKVPVCQEAHLPINTLCGLTIFYL